MMWCLPAAPQARSAFFEGWGLDEDNDVRFVADAASTVAARLRAHVRDLDPSSTARFKLAGCDVFFSDHTFVRCQKKGAADTTTLVRYAVRLVESRVVPGKRKGAGGGVAPSPL